MDKGCIYSTSVKRKLVTRSSRCFITAAVIRTLPYGAGIQSQGNTAVPGQYEFHSHRDREEWPELVHKAYTTFEYHIFLCQGSRGHETCEDRAVQEHHFESCVIIMNIDQSSKYHSGNSTHWSVLRTKSTTDNAKPSDSKSGVVASSTMQGVDWFQTIQQATKSGVHHSRSCHCRQTIVLI
jgi:hypothetical protein